MSERSAAGGRSPPGEPRPSPPAQPAARHPPAAEPESLATGRPQASAEGEPWLSLAGFEVAAVLAAILFALVFWLRLPGRLPGEQDYLAVQHELLAGARPGDGVAALPFWAERIKLFSRGLPVVALPRLAEDVESERYGRLWVLAQPDLPRSGAAAELEALDRKLSRVSGPKRFGPLSLSLYEPKSGRAPSYDFVAHLGDAQVSIGGDEPADCEARPGGFQCPRGPWNYVAPEWHEFDFLPRRCLWTHPVGPDPLRLRYSEVPLRGGLRGGFGIVGQAAELKQGAPVSVAVLIDGSLSAELTLSPGDPGWHEFDLGLPGLGAGGHEVELDVSAPDPAMRHFCLDAVGY